MIDSIDRTSTGVWTDRPSRHYAPGETLTGAYRLGEWLEEGLTSAELAVLWYTAGQGEEDFFVWRFERRLEAELPSRSDEVPLQYSTQLPSSPLSYEGQIVKVCWAVRLRGFFRGGRQRVIEEPFCLALPSDQPEVATDRRSL